MKLQWSLCSLLVQAVAMLSKSTQESGMNAWFQVQQSLEEDYISGVIPDNQACNILTGGIKEEALDWLNIALAGTNVSGLWALLKDTLGTASKTGSMYEEQPPIKSSHTSSIASDITTDEEIALAFPGTCASPHSSTLTPVHLTTFYP